MTVFAKLSAPFDPDQVSWRAQSVSNKDGRAPSAMALAYIDARDVMRRLDEACGPENWQCRYPHAGDKTICEIGVRVGNEWIWKANGAGDTDIEAEKGAISDAFKRAAVLWGIGRYLYDMPTVWAECELGNNGKWRAWTQAGLSKLRKAATGSVQADPKKEKPDPSARINDKTRDWLAGIIDASGIPVSDVCYQFKISSLKELTYGEVEAVRDWINPEKQKAA